MVNFKIFSDVDELKSINGTFSVITIEEGPIGFIPEAIKIDRYVDGEKEPGTEQIYETSDINSDILDASLEMDVYISEDAKPTYDKMIQLAELFEESSGNLDVYAEKLEELNKAEAEERKLEFDEDDE